MADRVDISAIARVVDQASGPLRSIEQAIGKTGQAARTASASVARLGSAGLFGGMAANLRGVGAAASRLGGQIKGFLGPILGLAGVAGIGGAIAAMKSYIDTGNEVAKVSRRLGITAEDLQKFRYAAGGAETADDALTKLQKTLATVSAGGKKVAPTAALLAKFSITQADVKAGDLSTILPKIAEGFKRNENPILRARMAMALFGKSGQTLVNFLAKGREGLEAAGAEAEALGLIQNQEAKDTEQAAKTWKQMETALTGVKNVLGAELLPVLMPVVEAFRDWLKVNRLWLREQMREAIKAIGDALKEINWTSVIKGLKSFGEGVNSVVKFLGGWKNALIALVVIMNASLIGSVLSLGLALGKLALSAGFALAALGPIGLAIAAVAALGFAAYLIYRNWDKIGPFIDAQMTTVKNALVSAREAAENWAATAVPEPMQQAWISFAERLGAAMEGIKTAIAGSHPVIDDFVANAVPGPIERAWSGFSETIGAAMEGVKTTIAGLSADPIKNAWEPLKGFFSALWTDVLGLFERAKQAIKSAVDWIVKAVEPLIGVISTVTGAIGAVGGAVGRGVASAATGALDYGRGLIGAAPSATAGVAAAAGPNLLQQQAAATAAAPPQRSEIEQRLKVDLSPELRASLTSERTTGAPVRSEVEIGRSMAPAWGAA